MAKDKDLVRFEISDEKQSGLMQSLKAPDVGDKVFVFGNSDGSGVATDLEGVINGVGPDKIEVTVPFVHGNSGSAVLDGDGLVLGVATYATHDVDPRDWTKRDTRFVCFRFECWQNGSLAGEYNSLRPATLNARKIPVDWFVRGKYPAKFDYGSETGSLKIGDVW